MRARITDPTAGGGRIVTGWEKRHVTWFATLDGALGYVLPLARKQAARLAAITNYISREMRLVQLIQKYCKMS